MRIIVFFTFFILFFACKEEKPVEIIESLEEQPILKIACIGDQITLGKGTEDAETEAYPVQLQRLLGERYIVKSFAVKDATVLKKGNNPYWQDTLFQDAQDFQPDIVLFHLGTNDTKIRNWWKYGKEFIVDYTEMINTFQALSKPPRILICRPIRIFDTIDSINDSTLVVGVLPNIDSIVVRESVETVDLYRILKNRGDLFNDGIHPNRIACRVMAEIIADVIISKKAE